MFSQFFGELLTYSIMLDSINCALIGRRGKQMTS